MCGSLILIKGNGSDYRHLGLAERTTAALLRIAWWPCGWFNSRAFLYATKLSFSTGEGDREVFSPRHMRSAGGVVPGPTTAEGPDRARPQEPICLEER